jgi:hypothetical protein
LFFKSGVCQLSGSSEKKPKDNDKDKGKNEASKKQETIDVVELDPEKRVYGHKEWKFTFALPETEEKATELLKASGFPVSLSKSMAESNSAFIEKHKEVTESIVKRVYKESPGIKVKDLIPILMTTSEQNFVMAIGSSKGNFFQPGEPEENKPKMIWTTAKGYIAKRKEDAPLYSSELQAYKKKHGLKEDPPLVKPLWVDTCKVFLSDRLAKKLGRENDKEIKYEERSQYLKNGAMVSFVLRVSGIWVDKGGIFHKQDVEQIIIHALTNLKSTFEHRPTKEESMFDDAMDESENMKTEIKVEEPQRDQEEKKMKNEGEGLPELESKSVIRGGGDDNNSSSPSSPEPQTSSSTVLKKQKIEIPEKKDFDEELKVGTSSKDEGDVNNSNHHHGGKKERRRRH